jgi:hypothetical protein
LCDIEPLLGLCQVLKLTAQTAQQLFKDIRVSLLPQTFQDAIHIAQRLGVNYLYIDSLYILQDSVEDWQREAATMAHD